MHNRWFHPPILHTPAPGRERKVGWLELFYDLIYVATIIQLGAALSDHVTVLGFLGFAGLMAPIWYAWTGFTFYSNRFVVDDFGHRLMVFLQMFGIGALAVSVPAVFEGRTGAFAISYACVRLVLVLQYVRAFIQVPDARPMTRRYAVTFGAACVLWLGSAWLAAPWVYLVWALAFGVDLSAVFSRQGRALMGRFPPDLLHMSERYGLLILIVLGESFVKVLGDLADRGATSDSALMGGMAILITCSLWWIYFDDVAGSRIKARRLAAFVWVYAHLPLAIAVTAVGVSIKKVVAFDPFTPGADGYRWLLCGSLGLALLSVGIIDAFTERRQAELSDRSRVNVRVGSALFILLLAPAGAFMPAWAFLALVVCICVLQVLFDVMMAPLAEDPHAHHEDDPQQVFQGEDAIKRAKVALQSQGSMNRDISESVRKGTPNELRRDLYFHFMEGSWTRVFFTVTVAYLLLNTAFAALYVLEPGSVSNVGQNSFLEAFFFSVQTTSTIGYGVMAPATTYAHVLVTVEAGLALLGAALVTGLVFAKASRPRASVLFSEKIVVTRQHGKPVLMFRVGNARGNEVVEATVRATALMDDVSPEGHRMRRLHDLKLVRDTTPIFILSWTVIHEIDETSPLFHLLEDPDGEGGLVVLATLTGHDSTYAQTIHARKDWRPECIVHGHRFVDVISRLPDGRMMVDYTKFHLTEPDEESDESLSQK